MTDKEIQQYLEKNCRHYDGSEMFDFQTFYEGAKWMRDKLENQKCKTFAPSLSTTSATKCRVCGKEKYNH